LASAQRLFGEKGYAGATIRGIAADAGVNPALVHHFFGSKEQLFVAAVGLPFTPEELIPRILEGPREEVGQRFVHVFLAVWRGPDTRQPFLALVRSLPANERAAAMMREFLEATLLRPVAEALGVPRLRVATAAAQLAGIALLGFVIGIEPLATAGEEELTRLVAPVIQDYLASS
jgi:AcrR family transcriptional regulator